MERREPWTYSLIEMRDAVAASVDGRFRLVRAFRTIGDRGDLDYSVFAYLPDDMAGAEVASAEYSAYRALEAIGCNIDHVEVILLTNMPTALL